jgi:hypothetical protein
MHIMHGHGPARARTWYGLAMVGMSLFSDQGDVRTKAEGACVRVRSKIWKIVKTSSTARLCPICIWYILN